MSNRQNFKERFCDYYLDPYFLPRSKVKAVVDIFPALWFAIRN